MESSTSALLNTRPLIKSGTSKTLFRSSRLGKVDMPNLVKVRNGAEGICGAGELYNSVLRSAIPEIRKRVGLRLLI